MWPHAAPARLQSTFLPGTSGTTTAETKSEIVVPIFAKGTVVGELDIDSHFRAAFQQEDIGLVEYCAALVGQFLEKFGARESAEAIKTATATSSSSKS